MAANDNLGLGIVWVPPSTNSADLEWRPGTSTDPELFPVASFDAATSQKMDGHGRMSPKYTGAPLKVSAPWMAAGRRQLYPAPAPGRDGRLQHGRRRPGQSGRSHGAGDLNGRLAVQRP
jgi:hypothetical protein